MVQLIKKLFNDKRVRFLFVGGLNTAVGYGSYALFIFIGWSPYLATTLSTVLGVINSYLWNKYFTFRKPKKSASEVFRFALVYLISFLMNLSLVYVFVDVLGMNPYLSGAICLLTTTLISYFGHNLFSFRDSKKKETAQ